MSRPGMLLISCLFAGCASAPEEPPADLLVAPFYVSGSRLRVEKWVTTDGAEQVVGLRDRDLGVRCEIGRSADGSIRCIPVDIPVLLMFSDAACTRRAALRDPAAGAPTLVRGDVYVSPLCPVDTPVPIFAAGASGQGQLYDDHGLGCVPDDTFANVPWVEAGAPLDPARMVAFGPIETIGTGRIARRVRVATDGASVTVGAVETVRGVPVEAASFADGSGRWMDTQFAIVDNEVGADCALPLAGRHYECLTEPATLIHDREWLFGCNSGGKTFAAGPVSRAYSQRGGVCEAKSGDERYYERGVALALESFEPVRKVDTRHGPLTVTRAAASVGAPVLPTATFRDVTLDTECYWRVSDTDPRLAHCTLAANEVGFADAACTQPATAAVTCAGGFPRHVQDASGAVRVVGAELESGLIFVLNGSGECVPGIRPVRRAALGAVVPGARLVEAVLTVE